MYSRRGGSDVHYRFIAANLLDIASPDLGTVGDVTGSTAPVAAAHTNRGRYELKIDFCAKRRDSLAIRSRYVGRLSVRPAILQDISEPKHCQGAHDCPIPR